MSRAVKAREAAAGRVIALGTALLSACATVLVPTQVQLASLKPGTEFVALVDARPVEARDEREKGRGYARKYLADDAIQPRVIDLVASRLADALPESYRGRPIELHRLDIGFLLSQNALPTSSDTTLSLPPGTSGGIVVAAVLLGAALIAAVNRSRPDELAVASIDVWIGQNRLRSARTAGITTDVGPAQAVESALAAALDDLARQAADLELAPERSRHN